MRNSHRSRCDILKEAIANTYTEVECYDSDKAKKIMYLYVQWLIKNSKDLNINTNSIHCKNYDIFIGNSIIHFIY